MGMGMRRGVLQGPFRSQSKKMIYHFYKADCYRASRVLMQKNWDGQCKFIHTSARNENPEDCRLSLASVAKEIKNSTSRDVMIFHAQSGLPYLLFAKLVSVLYKKKPLFIYDIHDLHEKNETSPQSIRSNLRYAVLGLLEFLVFRLPSIRKITVSNGLAQIMASKYLCDPPVVVRNISIQPKDQIWPIAERLSDAVVFFGKVDRFPWEALRELQRENIKLHIYGSGMTEESVEKIFKTQKLQGVSFLGEYDPLDLSFLNKYRVLLLIAPSDLSLNFRHSLPNKLFQAIANGLTVVVSENFREMIQAFPEFKAVVPVSRGDVGKTVLNSLLYKSQFDTDAAASKVKKYYEEDKRAYKISTSIELNEFK